MADPITPNSLMTTIRDQVTLLNTVIDECAVDATVFKIDHYEQGTVPALIETTKITGYRAVTAAQKAYREFSRHKPQHPSNVLRLPGILTVDKKLNNAIDRINKTKTQLKEVMQKQYPNARTRNAYCRNNFPGRMMLQVYRHIYYTEREVVRASFTWEPVTRSTKHLTRNEALDRLLKKQQWMSQTSPTDSNAVKAIEIALQKLYDSSLDTRFVVVKPRAPHPRMSLYFDANDYTDKITTPANLPIVVPHTDNLEIGNLTDLHTTSKKRNTRSDSNKIKSVYMPLNLYQLQT